MNVKLDLLARVNSQLHISIEYYQKFDSYWPYWWLVRATFVVDGQFFGHLFWKVEGTVHIHMSQVQLRYMVINVHGNTQGGVGGLNQTSENMESSEIFKLQ